MILAPDFLVFSFWFLVFVYYAVTQLATQLPQRRIQNSKFLAKHSKIPSFETPTVLNRDQTIQDTIKRWQQRG